MYSITINDVKKNNTTQNKQKQSINKPRNIMQQKYRKNNHKSTKPDI